MSSFLNSPHSHVTQDVLEELARVTTAELQAIVRSVPQLHAQAGKKSLFQIVLVEYEPASKKVIVGNVQTRLTENLEVVPYSSVLKSYIPDNLTPGILGFGETDFIRGLYSSVGRGAVNEGTRTFFANRKPISEISADEAVEVATSVIDASAANEQTLGIIPARISPPIDVVTVGAWGVKKIRWK